MPAERGSVPNRIRPHISSVTPTSTAPSRWNAARVVATGRITAVRPRMPTMLTMLLPTTLPRAIPGEPRNAACRLATSSGVDVPNPTSVKPITSGDSPRRRAMATAPFTSASPPPSSRSRPIASWTKIKRNPLVADATTPPATEWAGRRVRHAAQGRRACGGYTGARSHLLVCPLRDSPAMNAVYQVILIARRQPGGLHGKRQHGIFAVEQGPDP